MCKNLLFYTVAGLLISLALGGLGVSTPLSMLAAILIPPLIQYCAHIIAISSHKSI